MKSRGIGDLDRRNNSRVYGNSLLLEGAGLKSPGGIGRAQPLVYTGQPQWLMVVPRAEAIRLSPMANSQHL